MAVKWFQISGIMFGNDQKTRMHTALENFIEKNKSLFADLDYLFITGDLGFNSEKKDDAIEIINFFQRILGIKAAETFIVPGEKDIAKNANRTKLVNAYSKQRKNENKKTIQNIMKCDKDFFEIQKNVSDNLCTDAINVFSCEKAYIICLNTAILTNAKQENINKTMIDLALDYDEILDIEKNGKPVIVEAHHDFKYLAQEDQKSLENLLKDKGGRIYLCGHGEKCDFYSIDMQRGTRTLWEIHCGSGNAEKDNLYFSIGEMADDGSKGIIKFFKLSPDSNEWLPYTEFYRAKGLEHQDYVEFDLNKQKKEEPINRIVGQYMDKLYEQCQSDCMGGMSSGQAIPIQKVRNKIKFNSKNSASDSVTERINKKSQENDETDVILRILESENINLYIGAELGGGKTTLVESLALKAIDNWKKDELSLFPVRILCHCIGDPKAKIEDIIQEYFKYQFLESNYDEEDIELFIRHMDEKIEENKVLLLIDGLDEIVEDSSREIFLQNLEAYIQEKRLSSVVVSSRIEGYKSTYDVAKSFTKLDIAPWIEEDIITFCNNWCNEMKIDQKENERLIDRIIQDNSILKLARNPLLLTSMLMSKKNRGRIPSKRSEVYKDAVDMFLQKWNTDRHETWDLEETRIILSYVAFYMTFIRRDSTNIRRAELKIKILEATKYVEELSVLRKPEKEGWEELFLKCVEQSSGVLIERGSKPNRKGEKEELYVFRNQGFQAYLAAYALVNEYYQEHGNHKPIDILKDHKVFEKTNTNESIIVASELSPTLGKEIVNELYCKIEYIDKNCVYPDVRFDHLKYYKNLIIQLLGPARITKKRRADIYELVFDKILAIQIKDIKELSESDWKEEFGQFVEKKREECLKGKVSYDLPIMYEFCKGKYDGEKIYREYKRLTKSKEIEDQKLAMMYADVGIMLSSVGYSFMNYIKPDKARVAMINDLFRKANSKDSVVAGAAAAGMACFICVGEGMEIRERLYQSPEMIENIIKAAVDTNSIYIMVLCRYFDIHNSIVQTICQNQPQDVKDWIAQAYQSARGHSQKIGSFWMCVACRLWSWEKSEEEFQKIKNFKKISQNERNELDEMWRKYTDDSK